MSWRSEKVAGRGVGGWRGLGGLDVCLCQMRDVIFPSHFTNDEGRREWLVKEHARWKDARQMSALTFPPFFFIFWAFLCLCLRPSSSFLLTSYHHLFSFTLGSGGITDRSQLERGLKASSDISVIIKPALRLPNTSSSLMCIHSQTHTYMHIYTHTTWQREATAFLTEDRHSKRRTKNTLLIRSWGDCRNSSPVWWQNGKHMSKLSSHSAKLTKRLFGSLLCYNNNSTTPSGPQSLYLSKLWHVQSITNSLNANSLWWVCYKTSLIYSALVQTFDTA